MTKSRQLESSFDYVAVNIIQLPTEGISYSLYNYLKNLLVPTTEFWLRQIQKIIKIGINITWGGINTDKSQIPFIHSLADHLKVVYLTNENTYKDET